MKIQLKITISLLAILMLTSFVIAGECDNYSGSYIYTENIPSEESDGCDWKNLDSRDPIQNLKTLNNHYGYWGCDDSSTQVTYCLITSCDGVGQACGTNTGECVAGNYVCSTSGLYCNGAVEPTAESLDGLDNDCDGTVDNVVNLKNPKYFPNTWYTANSNFSMLESEKNCSQVSDNTDDGWSAPQNICSYGNGSTSCSNGCSGNYLIVKPSVPQTAPVSQISSVKLLVYFTPRGASHSGENINIGLRVGSANYGVDFDVTNSSPKTIDLTSKKNWSWNDLKNAVIYMKLQNPINLDFDLVKLWVSGYGCAGSEVVCDGIDDDCDGQTDEGVKNTYFLDFDNDNSGSILNSQLACSAPNNYVSNADDCDDSNPNIKPTATENITNGVDDDCDGLVDEGKTKQTVCVGSKPSNSEYNYGTTNGNFTQTWDGVNWDPTTMDYHHNNVAEECAWKCSSGYLYDSPTNSCAADLIEATCTGSPPTNAIWNDNGQQGNYTYRTGEPNNLSANYNTTADDCVWTCGSQYHYDNGSCLDNSNTNACDLTDLNGVLPSNAKWNSSNTFTQNWSGSEWLPTTKKATYNEVEGECNYSCIATSKNCVPNKETYCGSGVSECDKGDWGACIPTQAKICTTNQYCLGSDCLFCNEGSKNCDSNLLNGCESNINSDINNCGSCGVVCAAGQSCTNGVCGTGGVIPTDPCENISCGDNSTCNIGNCVCETGYNNCNGSNTDGCEKVGSCNSTPQNECETNSNCETSEYCNWGSCIEKECETDDECGGTCVDYKCVDEVEKSCLVPEQCGTKQTCVDGYCATLVCGEGFIIKNRACSCDGEVCDSICYQEDGICCNGNFRIGQSACANAIDVEYIRGIVDSSNDDEAIELFDTGVASLENNDVEKANAELAVAELKARLVLANNPSELVYDYANAKVALGEGNYSQAESLAKETIDKIKPSNDYNLIVTIIVIIIIIAVFVFFLNKKKQFTSIEEEY